MTDPQTEAEWQAAADAAEFLLLIDSARQYGLITGAEGVNADRCQELLARAAERGIFPTALESRRRWVGWWLLDAREGARATQYQVARRANVSQSLVSQIERAAANVDDVLLGRLRAAIEQIRKEKGA